MIVGGTKCLPADEFATHISFALTFFYHERLALRFLVLTAAGIGI